MNVFGVGGWELAAILIIALIVAGPQRMAKWAYVLGQYMGQLRVMWSQVMTSIQKEFDDAGIDVKLPKNIPTRNDINRFAGEMLEPISKQMQSAMDEVNEEASKIKDVASLKVTEGKETKPVQSKNGTSATPSDEPPDENSFGTWSGTNNTKK